MNNIFNSLIKKTINLVLRTFGSRIFSSMCLCVFLLAFLSCSDSPKLPEEQEYPPGMGAFSLIIDDEVGRTILPDTPTLSQFVAFELRFTNTASSVVTTATALRRLRWSSITTAEQLQTARQYRYK
jgi:hypothetical protein